MAPVWRCEGRHGFFDSNWTRLGQGYKGELLGAGGGVWAVWLELDTQVLGSRFGGLVVACFVVHWLDRAWRIEAD